MESRDGCDGIRLSCTGVGVCAVFLVALATGCGGDAPMGADASAGDAGVRDDAGVAMDASPNGGDDGGGAEDAALADAGPGDAGPPLPTCTLGATRTLTSARGTPSLLADGARTFAFWAQVGQGIRAVDVEDASSTPVSTGLADGPFYAPVPFASSRGGLLLAAHVDDAISIARIDATGTAVAPTTDVSLTPGSGCGAPIVVAGDATDLVVWSDQASGGTCTLGGYALADDTSVNVGSDPFPVGQPRPEVIWDGAGWCTTRIEADGSVTITRVTAQGSAIDATASSSTGIIGTVSDVRLAHGPAGTLAAFRRGRDIYVAAVDDALSLGTPTRVAGSSFDIDRLELTRGRSGFGLAWTSGTSTLSFLALDPSGAPASQVMEVSRPGLLATVSAFGTLPLPIAMTEGASGWWLGWLESGAVVGSVHCE